MLRAIKPYKQKAPRLYSVRWLEARLDELTSRIVLLRGAGCVTCPALSNLTNGHLLTRTWRPTRWDIEDGGNCYVQCANCNMAHEGNPEPFRRYYISRFGQEALDDLTRRAHSHDKMSYSDLHELWERYKAILAEEKAA